MAEKREKVTLEDKIDYLVRQVSEVVEVLRMAHPAHANRIAIREQGTALDTILTPSEEGAEETEEPKAPEKKEKKGIME